MATEEAKKAEQVEISLEEDDTFEEFALQGEQKPGIGGVHE